MNSTPLQPQLPKDLNLEQKNQAPVDSFSRLWPSVRIALTSLSTVFCVIVLGISIALAADPAVQSYVVVWTAPQAGAALLWSGIEVATTYTGGKNRRDIHPGAHLAVQLLLWLGFSAGVGLAACILEFAFSFDDSDPYPENYDYYGRGGYGYYIQYYVHSMEAVIAFLGLLIIIHFLLFGGACIGTSRRRGSRNTTLVDAIAERPEYPIHQLQLVRSSPEDEKGELRSHAM
ncbi:hypothetical protein F5B19DRAFT_296835 [Rostrohypoxylon terebratum]|nr:hypothetical protein F5B19DRAFT_296835 [Rostrohypoxylon terebratum]